MNFRDKARLNSVANKAMQSLLSNDPDQDVKLLAEKSYKIAESMLEESKKFD